MHKPSFGCGCVVGCILSLILLLIAFDLVLYWPGLFLLLH